MEAKLKLETTPYARPEPPLRFEQVLRFQQRLFAEMSGALGVMTAFVGDRLGFFQALADTGPTTAQAFANHSGVCPDMTAEWLRVMACAGYIVFDERSASYTLPPEHATVLARGGPMSFAGALQQTGASAQQLTAVADALRHGGGLPQSSFSTDLFEGMERLSATWFESELAEHWIPAVPAVEDKLRKGARVADLGCGSGRALVEMAKAFPASRYVGFDSFPTVIERAKRSAAAAGVADKVSFEVGDVMAGIGGDFDLVTGFDSLHDLPEPRQGLAAMARAVRKGGHLMVLELALPQASPQDLGMLGVIMHATKLFYNLPVSLSAHATVGGNGSFDEDAMRTLCRQAGLTLERTVRTRNPLHKLYVMSAPAY